VFVYISAEEQPVLLIFICFFFRLNINIYI